MLRSSSPLEILSAASLSSVMGFEIVLATKNTAIIATDKTRIVANMKLFLKSNTRLNACSVACVVIKNHPLPG